MTDAAPAQQLLIEAFDRIHELVINLTDGLTSEIGWLSTRRPVEFDLLADLAPHSHPGRSCRSPRQDRPGLGPLERRLQAAVRPPGDGYGQTAEEVGMVRVERRTARRIPPRRARAHPELRGRDHRRGARSGRRHPLGSAGDRLRPAGQRDRGCAAAPGSGGVRARPRRAPGQRLAPVSLGRQVAAVGQVQGACPKCHYSGDP